MQSMEQNSLCANYQLIHSLREQTELLPFFFFFGNKSDQFTNHNQYYSFIFHVRKQVSGFLRCFGISLLWSFFQWFYSGGEGCGFLQFPTFGLKAWKQTYINGYSNFYCLQCCFILIHHPCQSLLNFEFFGCQVFLRFQPHLRWCGNDLLTPCEPFDPLWCYTFLGDIVATHQQTKGKLVPSKCTREQHDKLVWLQGLLEHLPFFQIRLLGMKKGFT